MPKNNKGFTLIELLIVIGIISILAGIVLVSINPAKQFGKANDSERKSEISSIVNAVMQYTTSPTARGQLPNCLLGALQTPTPIPECDTDSSGIGNGNGGFEGALELGTPADADTYDCSTNLIPSYLRGMPIDPYEAIYNDSETGYYIRQNSTGLTVRVYVISVGAEIFLDPGRCEFPGTTNPAMCISV